jgi:GNAT superfamily N-acetyltransferase
MTEITIAPLTETQFDAWVDANLASRGEGHLHRLMRFLQEVQGGKRLIWAAWRGDEFMGHITLQDHSEYPPFRKAKIPEIVDVWVEPAARRNAIGRRLLRTVTRHVHKINRLAIGLGVGVTSDYGAAHCLYASEGFVPDGTGLWAQGHQVKAGETVTMGYDTLLMWVKLL